MNHASPTSLIGSQAAGIFGHDQAHAGGNQRDHDDADFGARLMNALKSLGHRSEAEPVRNHATLGAVVTPIAALVISEKAAPLPPPVAAPPSQVQPPADRKSSGTPASESAVIEPPDSKSNRIQPQPAIAILTRAGATQSDLSGATGPPASRGEPSRGAPPSQDAARSPRHVSQPVVTTDTLQSAAPATSSYSGAPPAKLALNGDIKVDVATITAPRATEQSSPKTEVPRSEPVAVADAAAPQLDAPPPASAPALASLNDASAPAARPSRADSPTAPVDAASDRDRGAPSLAPSSEQAAAPIANAQDGKPPVASAATGEADSASPAQSKPDSPPADQSQQTTSATSRDSRGDPPAAPSPAAIETPDPILARPRDARSNDSDLTPLPSGPGAPSVAPASAAAQAIAIAPARPIDALLGAAPIHIARVQVGADGQNPTVAVVHERAGAVSVQIDAPAPHAARLVSAELPALRRALEQSGMTLVSADVSERHPERGGDGSHRERNGADRNRSRNDTGTELFQIEDV